MVLPMNQNFFTYSPSMIFVLVNTYLLYGINCKIDDERGEKEITKGCYAVAEVHTQTDSECSCIHVRHSIAPGVNGIISYSMKIFELLNRY